MEVIAGNGAQSAEGAAAILEENQVGNTIPTIQNEEELNALLGITPSKEEPKPGEGKGAPKKEEKPAGGAFNTGKGKGSEEGKEGEEEGEQGEEDGKEKSVTEYPSLVHYLNDRHELQLNLEGMDNMSIEQQAEAIDEVLVRMVNGVNSSMSEYQYIETLLADPEVNSLLRAKAEGKGLQDLYTQFSQTPLSLDDEQLVLKDFKTKYPKSSEEAIRGMVDALKKNSQFETHAKTLREQYQEEQSLSQAQAKQRQEAEAKARVETEARELKEFSDYLGTINDVYGVPLTPEMKQGITQVATVRDEEGLTYLDRALQSDDGVILAALGIAYMQQLIQNAGSLQGNRKNAKFVEKLFKTTEKLQGGSQGSSQQEDQYDPALLNRF